jgi:hypothetical protein
MHFVVGPGGPEGLAQFLKQPFEEIGHQWATMQRMACELAKQAQESSQ